MRIDAKNSRICGATYNGIECFDIDTGNSFSIVADALDIATGPNNVCWLDYYGVGSCTHLALPPDRIMNLQLQNDVAYSLIFDSRQLSQSSFVYSIPPVAVTNFSAGPAGICVNAGGNSFCSFTLPFVPMSSLTSLQKASSEGFGGFDGIFFLHTSTVFWTDKGNQNYGWFGLPGCDGVIDVCASISSEIGITNGFGGPDAYLRIALGYQAGYAATVQGALDCWGQGVCPEFSNVRGVTAFNGGACVEFASSATCFGSFSHTFLFDTFSCEPTDITVTINSEYYYDMQCAACPLGSQFSYVGTVSSCTQCPPNNVRGLGQSSCLICPNGFQANADQSACIQCLPYQYKSNTMIQCLDCGVGSQSNGTACFPCPDGYVRDSSMTSCSLCPEGSVPAFEQTSCFSCDSPAIWVGSWTSVSNFSYTTWTDGDCVDCPRGQYPTGFSCSSCVAPFIRTSETVCVSCPDGFEPNTSRTICLPCKGNTVRTGPTPFCFECPSGNANEEHTRCVIENTPFFTSSQSALLSFGILILVSTIAMKTSLSESKFIAGLSMGLFFIICAFVLPATKNK